LAGDVIGVETIAVGAEELDAAETAWRTISGAAAGDIVVAATGGLVAPAAPGGAAAGAVACDGLVRLMTTRVLPAAGRAWPVEVAGGLAAPAAPGGAAAGAVACDGLVRLMTTRVLPAAGRAWPVEVAEARSIRLSRSSTPGFVSR
jgi:hypothetical protein